MNGISGDDPDCFAAVLNKARSFAVEADLPFLITEYKDGLQGGATQRNETTQPPGALFCSVGIYLEAEIRETNDELTPQHCRLFFGI